MSSLTLTSNEAIFSCTNSRYALDRNYGGIVRRVEKSDGTPILDSFSGAAMQLTWDQGQDPTQGSADGPDNFPLAKIAAQDPLNLYRQDYAKEIYVDTSKKQYWVGGNAPMFWISHEAIDDFTPFNMGRPNGWNTLYNNFLGKPSEWFVSPGVPVVWSNVQGATSGYLLLGDTIMHQHNLPGFNRAAKWRNANFMIRTRISLKDASADSIAGIVFLKQIWKEDKEYNIDDVYSAPGYTCYVNKTGLLEVRDAAQTLVFSSNVGAAINTNVGVMLELRSDPVVPAIVQVYYSPTFNTLPMWLGSFKTMNFAGPVSCGLYASGTSGEIRFENREFFDPSTIYNARAYPVSEKMRFEHHLICQPEAKLYRTGFAGWLRPEAQETYFIQMKDGDWLTNAETLAFKAANGGLYPLKDIQSAWSGKANGLIGLKFNNVNRTDTQEGAALVDNFILGVHMLPYSAELNPIHRDKISFVSEWETNL